MQKLILSLFDRLHACPEHSGREQQTRALLEDFLRTHTRLELRPCGNGFYAAHREEGCTAPSLALRADYDAVAAADGSARHLCGHDGHAAALCGAALLSEGKQLGRNVFFLFQPQEETGEGARSCLELLHQESVDEIYGLHNLPGFPFGQVLTRPGTFACASSGLILSFRGKPAHAAYPEDGISPAPVLGRLLCCLDELAQPGDYSSPTMITAIGARMGEKAFGSAASEAQLWLTLRSQRNRDLSLLLERVTAFASELAAKHGLSHSAQQVDAFPATENYSRCVERITARLGGTLLPEPMRWSEDFGHYLLHCPGAYFGIGAGEDYPPLHTEDYSFPPQLIMPTVRAWLSLMEEPDHGQDH